MSTLPRVPGRRLVRLVAVAAVSTLTASCFGAGDTAPGAPAASRSETPAAAASPTSTPTPDPPPDEGSCRRVSVPGLRTIVNDEPPVPCRRRHTVVTFHVGEVPRPAARDALSSADEEVEAAADRICVARFADYAGGDRADRRLSMLTPTYFLPSSEQWALGARWLRCDVYAYATPTRLAGLPRSLEDALERDRVSESFGRCSPVSPSAPSFRHVVCTEEHRWRAVDIETVGEPDERYPGRSTVQNRAQNRCQAPVRDYLGTEEAFSYGFEVPQRDAWSGGDRVALCWARTSE